MYDLELSEIWFAVIVWLMIACVMTFIISPRVLITWIGKLYGNPEWVDKHLSAVHERLCRVISIEIEKKLKGIIPGMVDSIIEAMLTQVKDVMVRDITANFTLNDDVVTKLKENLSETLSNHLKTFKATLIRQVDDTMKNKETEVMQAIEGELITSVEKHDPDFQLKNELMDEIIDRYPALKYAPLVSKLFNNNNNSQSHNPQPSDGFGKAW